MKLWGSRIEGRLNPAVERLNASLAFDIRLYREDILGSRAWARALERAGVLDAAELDEILTGLERVRREFEGEEFEPAEGDEDIHTAVERRLTELIGPAAGKLHTGRSRNDQVATDFRLWTMRAGRALAVEVLQLVEALAAGAEDDLNTPMPGYTHLQPAQAVTWGHWAMMHAWSLLRDVDRLGTVVEGAAVLPLGSGALAGSGIPVDREWLARELGFKAPSPNSMDAVADRDFAAEFLFAGALLGVHLSRLAEQLVLFSSAEFGFVALDRSYATGSSLMPQKVNPDPLELARGKSGRLAGNLMGLLVTLKGLPSVYDKDLQEDKEPAFDTFDTLAELLPVLAGLVSGLQVQQGRMRERLEPALFATDMADYLVEKGVPFRAAHEIVGRVVRRAEERDVPLDELELEEFKAVDDRFEADVAEVFGVEHSLARRRAIGGTSADRLQEQLGALRDELGLWLERLQESEAGVSDE